jgi:Tfp pilus assembly protein PilN
MKKWDQMKSAKSILGIVFYKNTIAVSQVRSGGGTSVKQKPAEFLLGPEQTDIGELAIHAARFREFLKANNFSAKKAVVGLDAGRIFSTLLHVPPVKEAGMAEEIIRIQLERSTQLDMNELSFTHASTGDKVFAAAALKSNLEQIKSFLLAAGVRVVYVTAASLAVETDFEQSTGCTILEYPRSVELLLTQGGQVVGLRDLSGGSDLTAFLPRLCQEVNRFSLTQREHVHCMFKLSGSTGVHAGDAIRRLFDGAVIRTLPGARAASDLTGGYAQIIAEQCIAGNLPALNLLAAAHQRKRHMHASGWMKRAAAVAVLVVAAALFFAFEWQMDHRRIRNYQEQIASVSDIVKSAEIMIDQAGYARRWFNHQPVYLALLAELTRCFPERGSIWLNSLAVDESLNQVITGKASGEQAVLDVVDNLKSSPLFRDIKILYIRQAGKNTREETFAISFRFVPEN